jgi:hypothetical protein
VGYVARMRETRNAHNTLVGKPKGKRPLGRSRRRWEDNIRTYLRKIRWKCVEWTHVAQNRNH